MEKKNTLDLAGITAKCDYLINATLPYYQQFNEAFMVLKLTGCRVSELFEIERWSWLGDEIYSFQPQKGNTVRTVQLTIECVDFQNAIKGQYKPFGGLTKYQLYNIYDQVKGWDKLLSGDKDISLYVFRYRFAKQLYQDGYDVFTIASMMGYTNVTTVQSYLIATISEVFTKPPVGFVDIGGIWISQDNFAITDDGAGIYDFRAGRGLWLGRHYTAEAIQRVLDWLGVYRLPTRDEYAVIAYYCNREYGYPAACLSNDKAKWASINYFMLNAFDLDLGGAGRYVNYAFSFYRSQGFYLYYDAQNSSIKNLNVHSSSSVFNYTDYLANSACSVRVVIA
jgi:hypothetical protein